MANERDAILAALTASASWTALVAANNTKFREDWGRNGIEPSTAPYDAITGRLTPCAALMMATRTPVNLTHFGERAFFRLWVYHDSDYSAVQDALRVAKRLLDNTYITVDNYGKPLLRWVDDISEFPDESMGGAAAGVSRYQMLAGWH